MNSMQAMRGMGMGIGGDGLTEAPAVAPAPSSAGADTGADTGAPPGQVIVAGTGNWGSVLVRESYNMGALVGITDSYAEAMVAAHESIGSPAEVTVHHTLEDALQSHPNAAVLIATPPSTHYDVALIAINAGRDVWVEKPICTQAIDAADLVEQAKAKKTILFVDHLLRYNHPHRVVLDLVSSGWVGEVTHIRALRLNFGTVRTGESVLWSFAPHDVSLVLALCKNQLPAYVHAVGRDIVSRGVMDHVDLTLKFPGGVHAQLSASWLHYEKERRLIVYGKEGCLIVNESAKHDAPAIEGYKWSARRNDAGTAVKIAMHEQDMYKDRVSSASSGPQQSPVQAALTHFLDCCRTRTTPDTDGQEGVRVLAVLAAADESLARKRHVVIGESHADSAPNNAKVEVAQAAPQPSMENGPVMKKEIQDIQDIVQHHPPQPTAQENPVVMTVVQVPQPSLDVSESKTEDQFVAPPHGASASQMTQPMDTAPAPPAPAVPVRDYFVHATSEVDDGAVVGKGTKIWHYSHVMRGARIGSGCSFGQNSYVGGAVVVGDGVKVQNGVSIYDGVSIEDEVFLGPHCTFTNVKTPRSAVNRRGEFVETKVRKGASIGANATIICGNNVGEYGFVGAGAVVTRDVPDYACVMGNPAKFHCWVSQSGARLAKLEHVSHVSGGGAMLQCPETGEVYEMYGVGEAAIIRKQLP